MSFPCRYPLAVLLFGLIIIFSLSGCAPPKKSVDQKLDHLETRLTELELERPSPEIDPQKMERLIIIMKYGPAISYDQPTQKDAVIALGLLGDEEAVPALLEQFETSGDDNFKSYIANSLGWIGDKKAVPILKKALKSKNVHLRKRAALALEKIKEKSSLTQKQEDFRNLRPVAGFFPF